MVSLLPSVSLGIRHLHSSGPAAAQLEPLVSEAVAGCPRVMTPALETPWAWIASEGDCAHFQCLFLVTMSLVPSVHLGLTAGVAWCSLPKLECCSGQDGEAE